MSNVTCQESMRQPKIRSANRNVKTESNHLGLNIIRERQ